MVLIPLCRKGDRAGIERHLRAGADIQETDVEGNTPLHVAVEAPRNETATLQCLLEHGACINEPNDLGVTPLHCVVLRKTNQRGVAKLLLEHGAEVDARTLTGKTPLHFACEYHAHEVVEVLCLYKADTNLLDSNGSAPVHKLLDGREGRDTVKNQILDSLLRFGSEVQFANMSGFQPLHLASRWGHTRCVRCLLEHGANPTSPTHAGQLRASPCLSKQESRGDATVKCKSVDLGERLGPRNLGLLMQCFGKLKFPLLVCEATYRFQQVVQLILEWCPFQEDAADSEGNTALHHCAMSGSLDCASLLLKSGADTTIKNLQKKTALDLARQRGSTDLNSTFCPELAGSHRRWQKKQVHSILSAGRWP